MQKFGDRKKIVLLYFIFYVEMYIFFLNNAHVTFITNKVNSKILWEQQFKKKKKTNLWK
jgi:hypothetical protein